MPAAQQVMSMTAVKVLLLLSTQSPPPEFTSPSPPSSPRSLPPPLLSFPPLSLLTHPTLIGIKDNNAVVAVCRCAKLLEWSCTQCLSPTSTGTESCHTVSLRSKLAAHQTPTSFATPGQNFCCLSVDVLLSKFCSGDCCWNKVLAMHHVQIDI